MRHDCVACRSRPLLEASVETVFRREEPSASGEKLALMSIILTLYEKLVRQLKRVSTSSVCCLDFSTSSFNLHPRSEEGSDGLDKRISRHVASGGHSKGTSKVLSYTLWAPCILGPTCKKRCQHLGRGN